MAHGAALAEIAEESLKAVTIGLALPHDGNALHGMPAAVECSAEMFNEAEITADRRIIAVISPVVVVVDSQVILVIRDVRTELEVFTLIIIYRPAVHLLGQQVQARGRGDDVGMLLR